MGYYGQIDHSRPKWCQQRDLLHRTRRGSHVARQHRPGATIAFRAMDGKQRERLCENCRNRGRNVEKSGVLAQPLRCSACTSTQPRIVNLTMRDPRAASRETCLLIAEVVPTGSRPASDAGDSLDRPEKAMYDHRFRRPRDERTAANPRWQGGEGTHSTGLREGRTASPAFPT